MDSVAKKRFKILSDPSRVKILRLLSNKSLTVNEIVERLQIDRTLTSHHLKILREECLIEANKKGRHVHYQLGSGLKRSLKNGSLDFGCCEIKFK